MLCSQAAFIPQLGLRALIYISVRYGDRPDRLRRVLCSHEFRNRPVQSSYDGAVFNRDDPVKSGIDLLKQIQINRFYIASNSE